MNLAEMLHTLRSEPIKTWFDLGLFIDRFREQRPVPAAASPASFQDFCQKLNSGGIALISFDFNTEPVAQTAAHFVNAISEQLKDASLHAISGEIGEKAPLVQQHRLPEVHGFDRWRFYRDFFHTRLERGGPQYNRLIGEFWSEVLELCQKLGEIIQANQIQLLYLINANSLLGNVSLGLAIVLLSEYLNIPVINHSLEFYWTQGHWLPNAHLGELLQIEVLFPWDSRSWLHLTAAQHVHHLIEMKGLNPANVMACDPNTLDLQSVLYQLFLQLEPNDMTLTGRTVEQYRELCRRPVDKLLPAKDQHYLPGYGRTEFMLYLKSLIDPSYFRVEEQQIRGIVMRFAQELVQNTVRAHSPSIETLHRFYNAVDKIFLYRSGALAIQHDHSFAYRHRNTLHYPYRDLTHQELNGLVNQLFHQIVDPDEHDQPAVTDWDPVVGKLALDDRLWLDERLTGNAPMAYFPGVLNPPSLEYLILRPARAKLGLAAKQAITLEALAQNGRRLAAVTLFCREQSCGRRLTAKSLQHYLSGEHAQELDILYRHNFLQIVPTEQWCKGIHLAQLGKGALDALEAIRERGGYLVSDDWEAAMMTDVMDIDRFHLGRVEHPLSAKMLGIPLNSDYIQYVPAGVRTTLAYPTPIQTAHDFSQTLKSAPRDNVQQLFQRLRQENNCPIKTAIQNLLEKSNQATHSPVETSFRCGRYRDGRPWSGLVAKIEMRRPESRWQFAIQSGHGRTRPVTEFAADFARQHHRDPDIAWNGGFILNAELVGKLGLAESFIGSPLGLIISDGEVICPPLFNKPAFLIYPNGRLDIQRVNCNQGITVSDGRRHLILGPAVRNPVEPPLDKACFYDLLADQESLQGDGRVIVQLAGNVIKTVTHTRAGPTLSRIPVGLTLSFPGKLFPAGWDQIGKTLQIKMLGWTEVKAAIEAGPLLVDDGRVCIDLGSEGWYTSNSIQTQAARLDYTDMRGPKIAIGLGRKGNLSILAINGRIRESVGATYQDMAQILVELGMQKAMGFDPGGSSTLVVNGKPLNISPYNANYEQDVYSLPPQPRAVGNAVIGYQEPV